MMRGKALTRSDRRRTFVRRREATRKATNPIAKGRVVTEMASPLLYVRWEGGEQIFYARLFNSCPSEEEGEYNLQIFFGVNTKTIELSVLMEFII